MALKAKKRGRSPPATKNPAENKGGNLVCALCGKIIRSTAEDLGIIYSICPACKLIPPRAI